jgi:general nucleoside transport system permease protein
MSWIISLLAPGIRMASPLILASMGGIFTQRAGNWNIGLESYMLFSAFFGVWVGMSTGSLGLAFLAAILAGIITALLMALFVVSFKSDEIIVGIAMNLVGQFLTAYLLDVITKGGGFMRTSTPVPVIHIPLVENIPVLGQILSGHDLLVYVSWISIAVVSFIIYRTQFGLQLRAAGEDPESATAAGVSVPTMKYLGFAFSGLFTGLAGFQLAVSFLQLFSMNMAGGRGIIAFAAVIFGNAVPGLTAIAALVFGMAQALANQVSTINIPVQFVLMIPYLLTILVLFLAALRRREKESV